MGWKRIIGPGIGVLLAFGLWTYFTARNRGLISPDVNEFFLIAWFAVLLAAMPLVTFYRERRYFGQVSWKKFGLQPGERLIFAESFLRPIFYPDANDFKAGWRLGDWIADKPAACATLRVRVILTDRRLVVRSMFGYNWREIPLSNVRRVVEAKLRDPLVRAYAVGLVEYNYNDHTEGVAIPSGSAKAHSFFAALRSVIALG